MSRAQYTGEWRAPSPFEGREADFEPRLDRWATDFKIDDRATLKGYVEGAARIYYHKTDRLAGADLRWLLEFAPKMEGALLKNALAVEGIVTDLEQQHLRGFEPGFCKGAYDPSKADAFMTRYWQAAHTLKELAAHLSEYSTRGRPPNAGLHGAVKVLQEYWAHELGRELKTGPWNDANRFLKAVFKFIDPAVVCKLPSAMKRRVKGLDKTTR